MSKLGNTIKGWHKEDQECAKKLTEKHAAVLSKLRIKFLSKTCKRVPAQWEGVLDNDGAIYIRYRFGALSMGMGLTIDDAVDISKNLAVIGKEWEGSLNTGEMLEYLLTRPKTYDRIYKDFSLGHHELPDRWEALEALRKGDNITSK